MGTEKALRAGIQVMRINGKEGDQDLNQRWRSAKSPNFSPLARSFL